MHQRGLVAILGSANACGLRIDFGARYSPVTTELNAFPALPQLGIVH